MVEATMSTGRSQAKDSGQNQHASISALIQILGIIIPTLGTITIGLIGFSQKRMEVAMPIAATQTAEANRPLVVISTSAAPTSPPSATHEAVVPDSENVDVLLNNPNTDAPSVHLIIKQDDMVIANLILPPGGTVPRINLPPGNYQVEARPIYPAITPSSPDCYVAWLPGELYKRDFVITSGKAVIQIQQFDLGPQEICFTETPVP
jgi:hypothetical protein